ncbi:hypothetical protein CRM22_004440 [Opisthorchis felineus]|uniref:Cathepsin L n=1 Tax=Opisthorchis felineus TaxID=147828 RepID=A0A4S2M1H2_OPIFE|nr:hypothetical protein CRM22_004440 [Opisthorchis felineus]
MNNKTVLLLCAICIVIVAANPNFQEVRERQLYEEFKVNYGKVYENEDDKLRFAIFKNNLKRVQHYQNHDQGTAVYGITKFSDLTAEEFRLRYLGARFDREPSRAGCVVFNGLGDIPERFDWRELGAVGPIQDQGDCGSCWAFSTIGNIEGQWFKKTGQLLTLSEQQLVDCDSVDDGCGGGYPPDTYGDIVKMGGLELNADYPYIAADGVCKMDRSKFRAYVNKSLVLPTKEEQQAAWLAKNGPLSAGINADYLQFYISGVMHPTHSECSPSGLNHAVLSVGFGSEHNIPYWIVRNSWGKNWGEKGYFRIYRGDGTCGINTVCSSAVVL